MLQPTGVPVSPLGALLGFAAGVLAAPVSSVIIDRPPLRNAHSERLLDPFRCSNCRGSVRWRDAIPVIGALVLGNRCRSCARPIAVQELFSDVLCLAVGTLTGAFIGVVAALPALLLLALTLVPMSLVDLRLRKIPTRLVYPAAAAVAGLLAVAALVGQDPARFVRAVAGGLLASMFVWVLVIVYPSGMGDGDARLCLLLGLGLGWFGWVHLAYGLMAGFVIGAVVGIGYAIASGQGRKTQLPFGPWLAAGAMLAICGAPRIAAYTGL